MKPSELVGIQCKHLVVLIQSFPDKMEFHFRGLCSKFGEKFSILSNFHYRARILAAGSEVFHFHKTVRSSQRVVHLATLV